MAGVQACSQSACCVMAAVRVRTRVDKVEVGVRLTEDSRLWVCASAGALTLSRQELGSGQGCWPLEQMQNLPEHFFSTTSHVWEDRMEEGDTPLRAWQCHDVTIVWHREGVTYSILMPF